MRKRFNLDIWSYITFRGIKVLIIFDKVFNSSEPAMGNNYGKTHKSIFSRKASIECLGGGGGASFAGGHFKKSVKNRFLTKPIFGM